MFVPSRRELGQMGQSGTKIGVPATCGYNYCHFCQRSVSSNCPAFRPGFTAIKKSSSATCRQQKRTALRHSRLQYHFGSHSAGTGAPFATLGDLWPKDPDRTAMRQAARAIERTRMQKSESLINRKSQTEI